MPTQANARTRHRAHHRVRYIMQENTNRNAPGACSDGLAGDYDGNGVDDLAISAPGENIDGGDIAGGVYVLYGANGGHIGLTSTGETGVPAVQYFTKNSPGFDGTPQAKDRFGRCLAAADFNSDGFSDLVIGVPGQTVNGAFRAGAVYIVYGSDHGLDATQSEHPIQLLTMAGLDIPVEGYQDFGSALTVGDYNADEHPDLAVGAPLRNIGGATNAGGLAIVYGTANGLTTTGREFITQGDIGAIPAAPETGDFFAASLASGDLNGDGYSDLAVGVPGENLGPNDSVAQAGAVDVLYGGRRGLLPADAERWTQDDTGVFPSQAGANFGWALGIGNTNTDNADDLVVAAPFQNLAGVENAGSATLIPGSRNGLTSDGAKFFNEQVGGVGLQKDAYFGAAVLLANFDNDDQTNDLDLLVGVPGRNADHVIHSGSIDVMFADGSPGLQPDITEVTQDTEGVPDSSEPDDHFGLSLSAGEYNNDDPADIAIGAHEVVPGDAGGEQAEDGAVTVLYSGHDIANNDQPAFAQFWTENSPGMPGTAQNGDFFGRAVQ